MPEGDVNTLHYGASPVCNFCITHAAILRFRVDVGTDVKKTLEGAVRARARMSSSADRSRCSRGELVAPVAETPSRAASEAVVGMNMA